MAPKSTIQPWRPNLQGVIHPSAISAINLLFDAVQDHDTAIVALDAKVGTKATAAATAASTSVSASTPSSPTASSSFPYLGDVNVQAGTFYATQLTDNGALLVLTNAAAIAVTLVSTVTAPWFMSVVNLGTSTAVFTPSSGQVNRAGSLPVAPGGGAFFFFDGVNFWAPFTPLVPKTTPTVAQQWLASYSAATGTFTQSQPMFADIGGQATAAQLPPAGLSVTITTAQLTPTGTQGSQTFVHGQLTAQTPAT